MSIQARSEVSTINEELAKIAFPWNAGLNSMVLLPEDERSLRLGYVPGPDDPSLFEAEQIAKNNGVAFMAPRDETSAHPIQYDWRAQDGGAYVPAVRNQGSCGSCVAFGTTGALTVQTWKTLGRPGLPIPSNEAQLSSAYLYYCVAEAQQNRKCSGPNGGWWPRAATSAVAGKGCAYDYYYGYYPGDQPCRAEIPWTGVKAASADTINDINTMKTYISATGPLVAAFTVYADFFSYVNGVYQHTSGEIAGGHCIAVMGYSDTLGAWLCQNSWGASWGMAGYFWIGYGQCGIDDSMYAMNGLSLTTGNT